MTVKCGFGHWWYFSKLDDTYGPAEVGKNLFLFSF